MALTKIVYNREKLYAEIWSEPATTVAKRYAISSVTLARVCKRLKVPVPQRGYWARRAVGDIELEPPLPAMKNPEIEVVRKGSWPDRERIAQSLQEGRALMGPPIIVAETLETPHPLVASAMSMLTRAKVRNGLVSGRGESCLDIAVSPPLLLRAARIFNALILGLEERGLPVELTELRTDDEADQNARSSETWVLINGERIRFGIVERLRQHLVPSTVKSPRGLTGAEREFWAYWNRPRVTLVPSGTLVLSIKETRTGVQGAWFDGQRKIEQRLNDFVKQLFGVAEAMKQMREANASWRETYHVQSQQDREKKQHAQAEAEKLAVLRDALARWREARDIRRFVRWQRSSTSPSFEQDEMLGWALSYADSIERGA